MKKAYVIILIVVAALLAAAGVVTGVRTYQAVERAEAAQEVVNAEYQAMKEAAAGIELPVYEAGNLVGCYTLEDLGLMPELENAIEAAYSEAERMDSAAFAELPLRDKLLWNKTAHPENVEIVLPMEGFDPAAVLADLNTVERKGPESAYMTYEDGIYRVHDEVLGNVLREDVVTAAIREVLTGLVIAEDAENPALLDVTDSDCYLAPEVTVKNGGFNPGGDLYAALSEMEIRVRFHTGEEVLTGEDLKAFVTLDTSGAVEIDEEQLSAILAGWAAQYNAYSTPYLFDSYAGGVVPISFLLCQYEIRQEELRELIRERIIAQEGGTFNAPYDCYDKNWQPFGIENTYVEVDIHNQQITYYKNGELIVNSDVVTGRVSAHWDTPEGLYSSYDNRPNRWLIGADYAVYVKYWVRFWNAYGLHDASWRDEFGGDIYLRNGSHGCVNIPEEAMVKIYENIEDGTPVLVFDYNPDLTAE